jgi:deoxyribodipyrimidine photo-lyase
MPMTAMSKKRLRLIKDGDEIIGPVIYAMSRDQRVDDNWALLYAQGLAIERNQPLMVACPIAADYPSASQRQIDFMMAGLREVEHRLTSLNIRFVVSDGPAAASLAVLAENVNAGALICDFNPLRESRQWKEQLSGNIRIPFFEVDAHNIIPCWEASDKQEYAAYTIRPKINRKMSEFLSAIPNLVEHPFDLDENRSPTEWSSIAAVTGGKSMDSSPGPYLPGEGAALKQLQFFLNEKLVQYNDLRNNPLESGQSNLSPYLHSGQLSAQRVALEAQRYDDNIASLEAFLEELIVRRELADNFCYYNDRYDSFDGFPEWAQKTLGEHRMDPRPYLYDRNILEAAATHDHLWNAAQTEMVLTGKMHGYMRMYWAKKILEWAPSPEEAMTNAIYMNNKYELDGHDPNGYAGIAWSIGGVHDRAWSEREIFGKIRYMSFEGCKRKFKVAEYIDRVKSIGTEATA